MSTSTSTIGIFQANDQQLLDDLTKYLKGDSRYNFVKGIDEITFHQRIQTTYPVFLDIILNLAGDLGMLEEPVR